MKTHTRQSNVFKLKNSDRPRDLATAPRFYSNNTDKSSDHRMGNCTCVYHNRFIDTTCKIKPKKNSVGDFRVLYPKKLWKLNKIKLLYLTKWFENYLKTRRFSRNKIRILRKNLRAKPEKASYNTERTTYDIIISFTVGGRCLRSTAGGVSARSQECNFSHKQVVVLSCCLWGGLSASFRGRHVRKGWRPLNTEKIKISRKEKRTSS